MAGDLGSTQTTSFSNVSIGGTDPNGNQFGALWAGSTISAPTIVGLPSQVSSSRGTFATVWATSQVTTPNISAISVNVPGGIQASGVTFDLRTNAVLISTATRGDSTGLTIGQLAIVFQASGVSLVFSSGKTLYTVGASAVSAVQG